jgi:hypothetical protein
MAHYTLIARINAGNGKFPFVNVQFSKNHRPVPIAGATYYLRPTSSGKRTPIHVGKDVAAAQTALIKLENGQELEPPARAQADPHTPATTPRKTVPEAAREYIERSKQKSRKTYLGYRTAVNLFVASCKKTYFDQISRDDMLDFLYELRTRRSEETGLPLGESTAFNYFLKVMVFLNVLATGLAGKDGYGAAGADSGYVFGCVCRAGGELVLLLLSGASDCGDPHRGVPRVGDCYR